MNGRRLYEEIGGVNERYLQQAATYRARRKAPVWRTVLIAASIALICAIVLGTLAFGVAIGVVADWLLGVQVQPGDIEQPEIIELAQMEQALGEKQQSLSAVDADGLGLFDGRAKLIWTDGDSGEYYQVSLSQNECTRICNLIKANKQEVTEQSERPDYQIWISLGDGTVITPYLKAAAGNAGHGELFDYDPELELSDALIELIIDCVQT